MPNPEYSFIQGGGLQVSCVGKNLGMDFSFFSKRKLLQGLPTSQVMGGEKEIWKPHHDGWILRLRV